MKKRNIYFFAVMIIAFIWSVPGFSQTEYYVYTYDASGNRILREVDQSKSAKIKGELSIQEKDNLIEEELEEFSVKIYPNPTDGILNISISEIGEETPNMLIYNMQGKLISDRKLTSTISKINLKNQPPGMYLLRLKIGTLTSEWKIIKE